MTNLKGRLIFDNGGGLTLQLGDWAHYYGGYDGCIVQAAEDIINYIKNGNTDGWDGHEEEAAELDPIYDEIRNGGYRVYTISEIIEECKKENSTGWYNIDDFCSALSKLI